MSSRLIQLTKKELIEAVNQAASNYVGFNITCYGIKNKTKQELIALLLRYTHAYKLKRLAVLLGSWETELGIRYNHISNNLWLGDNLSKVIKHANLYYPRKGAK